MCFALTSGAVVLLGVRPPQGLVLISIFGFPIRRSKLKFCEIETRSDCAARQGKFPERSGRLPNISRDDNLRALEALYVRSQYHA